MDVYLDHNATSPLLPQVAAAMEAVARETFANPSSLYPAGQRAREIFEDARARLAATVGARAQEVIFTSGATEAINQAIIATSLCRGGGHIVTTGVEHAAVRRCVDWLGAAGYRTSYVRCQRTGRVDPSAIAAALADDTVLVAVQAANNELGTVQPIAEIAEMVHARGALLLVDAVQALGKLPLDFVTSGADLMSLSAHKVGGPKGVGALLRRWDLELPALLHGGGQEFGWRSGTENVSGAVGFAVAAEVATARRATVVKRWEALRGELLALTELLPDCRVNGHGTETLANTLSIAFRGVNARELTVALGRRGVAVSAGSACCAGRPSEVLQAIGLDEPAIRGTIRFSMGPDISAHELRAVREIVVETVTELRTAAPEA